MIQHVGVKQYFYMFGKNLLKRNLIVNYDDKADVMYISFEAPQKANDTEFFSDDILVRKKDNKLIGLTLLHFKKKLLT